MFLKYPVIYSHAAFQSYKLEENMQLTKEGLEKGMKETTEGELKRSPGDQLSDKVDGDGPAADR